MSAVVDSVKDAPVLLAIQRGAAAMPVVLESRQRGINKGDAAEILYALLTMKLEARMHLAARLLAEQGGSNARTQ